MKFFTASLLVLLFATQTSAQWELIQLEQSEEPLHFRIDFRDSLHGHILSSPNQFWRTEDGGDHWAPISTFDLQLTDFIYLNGDTILALGSLGNDETPGLYRSDDNGSNWELAQLLPEVGLYRMVRRDSLLFLCGNRRIYRSTALGEDLQEVLHIANINYFFGEIADIFPTSDSVIYATGYGLHITEIFRSFLLKSEDGGLSWAVKNVHEDFSFTPPALHFHNDSTGFYLASDGESHLFSRRFHTTDGGDSWTEVEEEMFNGYYDISFPSDSVGYIIAGHQFMGLSGVYRYFSIRKTTDGGQQWQDQFLNEAGAPLLGGYFRNDSLGFAIGRFGVILKTETCGGAMDPGYPFELFIVDTEDGPDTRQSRVFPNPAGEQLFIEVPPALRDETCRLSVFDGKGRLLEDINIGSRDGYELDCTDYPRGLLILQLSSEQFSETHRILKQ